MFLTTALAAGLSVSYAQTPAAAPAAPAAAPAAAAPATPPPPKDPTLEQRVDDIEAYISNGSRHADTDPKTATKIPGPGPGHNAWMLTSSAFVLMMTLPGLALFYGGLVRKKNVLSVLAQCFGITGLVSILWYAFGYSLVFGTSFNGDTTVTPNVPPSAIAPFLGGSEFFFMKGINSTPNGNYGYWVSQNVYCIFQLTFAIITPALIVGSIAERMKFSAVMLFIGAWMFIVYFPLAHMVWGASGLMNGVWNSAAKITACDFAGGTVVHMSSGYSALVLCILLGKRLGYGTEAMPPHSIVLCMVGTSLLWVGWYGFNAGSAVAADVIAANAFLTTTYATAIGSFTWAVMEKIFRGKASVLGFCSGAVAGLVVITPACGFVNATGSVIIGIAAGAVPFLFVTYVKKIFGFDDALDTFGVHAIGGTIGAFLTGVLADGVANPNLLTGTLDPATGLIAKDNTGVAATNGLAIVSGTGKDAVLIVRPDLWLEQVKAIGITIALAVIGTLIIGLVVKAIIGLRPTPEQESQGLDIVDHGEEGYVG